MKSPNQYLVALRVFSFAISIKVAVAQDKPAEIHPSPDGQQFVAWFDHNADEPLGYTRSIILRNIPDENEAPFFSFVGPSRSTLAVWNSTSSRCVISHELNWEETLVWVVSKSQSGEWHSRNMDVLGPIKAAFLKARGNNEKPAFRVHMEKIEWESDTKVHFLVWSNGYDPQLASSGIYQVTFDTQLPKAKPTVLKMPKE